MEILDNLYTNQFYIALSYFTKNIFMRINNKNIVCLITLKIII